MKKRVAILYLLLGLSLASACQQAGTGPSGAAAMKEVGGSASAEGPGEFDAPAAADGERGGVLGTNPSPEQFQPDAGFKKKEDQEEDDGGEGAPLAYAKTAPLPKSECGGTLLRWVAWKEDIRIASGQANKTPEEFFKFLQSGGLDPEVATAAYFRDVCAKDDSPQTLADIPYPPIGLYVLFKAEGSAMTGLWAKPLTSADQLKTLLEGGDLITVGVAEAPVDGGDQEPAPLAPIKIPGKK